MNYHKRIIEILTRYRLRKELEPRELELLREWLMESKVNVGLFDDLNNDSYLNEHWPSELDREEKGTAEWIRRELQKICLFNRG